MSALVPPTSKVIPLSMSIFCMRLAAATIPALGPESSVVMGRAVACDAGMIPPFEPEM